MSDNFFNSSSLERQSWVATLGDASNNFTLTRNESYYWQIGKLIFYEFYLTWSSKGSATGNAQLGLPFTGAAPSGEPRYPCVITYYDGIGVGRMLMAKINDGNNYIDFWESSSGGAPDRLTANDFASTGDIQGGGWVIV